MEKSYREIYINMLKIMQLVILLTIMVPLEATSQTSGTPETLLVDLPGWDGSSLKINTIQTGTGKTLITQRSYSQGTNKTMDAMIVIGNTISYQSGFVSGKNIETPESKIMTQTIDGFNVVIKYNKQNSSGAVMVMIKGGQVDGAIFILEFKGINDIQAVDLSQKFNWNEIKAKT